jgi:hypothetical protein
MDVTDEQGKVVRDVPINGAIKGLVFNKSNLPGYWLYLNVNGLKMKRSVVPQNPNKTNSVGAPTWMAQKVREGWAVMWVISEKYDTLPSEMLVKIETQPGQATTYTIRPFGNK